MLAFLSSNFTADSAVSYDINDITDNNTLLSIAIANRMGDFAFTSQDPAGDTGYPQFVQPSAHTRGDGELGAWRVLSSPC